MSSPIKPEKRRTQNASVGQGGHSSSNSNSNRTTDTNTPPGGLTPAQYAEKMRTLERNTATLVRNADGLNALFEQRKKERNGSS